MRISPDVVATGEGRCLRSSVVPRKPKTGHVSRPGILSTTFDRLVWGKYECSDRYTPGFTDERAADAAGRIMGASPSAKRLPPWILHSGCRYRHLAIFSATRVCGFGRG